MAKNPLPRSNFGTASLVERRDEIPSVELEEGPGAEVPVEDDTLIEAPGLSIELEDDGGVVVDFDPRASSPDTGDFYDNLAENLSDTSSARISSDLVAQYEANKDGRKDWEDA